jgi:hypothetical protein
VVALPRRPPHHHRNLYGVLEENMNMREIREVKEREKHREKMKIICEKET